MAKKDMKNLLGPQEAVLELVQQDDGTMVLRVADSTDAPLVRISFNDDVRKMLGDSVGTVAQHMIQAGIFSVMEQQSNRWHAQVIDQKPQHFS